MALAIGSRGQDIGVGGIEEAFPGGVEGQLPAAGARQDVGQVGQGGREVPDLDIGARPP